MPFPYPSTIRAAWESVCMAQMKSDEQSVARLIDALRKTHVNGGAAFAQFSIDGNSDFRGFMRQDRWNDLDFPERFLTHPAVDAALPEVAKKPISGSFGFEADYGFTFAGFLARILVQGGAYKKHEAGPGDAYSIADDFRRALFGDRFEEVFVLTSFRPWSEWFWGVAWDYTWLVVDARQNSVSVLAITDTD